MRKINEIWKDIKGYEGLYQISNFGRIKSLGRFVKCKNGIRKVPEKILKNYKDRRGYIYISLSKKNKAKKLKIHRLIGFSFISNPENKSEINHIDGNKANNNINNLEWVTKSENEQHAWKIGLKEKKIGEKHHMYGKNLSIEHKKKISLSTRGEKSKTAKLTEFLIKEIRYLYKLGWEKDLLADMYNISFWTVKSIVNRYSWKHI